MKKILFVLSLVTIFSSCSEVKDSNFTIKGNMKGMRKGIVYLKEEVNGNVSTVDSLFLKGTEDFEFKGFIESPEVFYLSTSRRNSSILPVFVEKGIITVNADVNNLLTAEISGSENQELLDQFNKIMGRFNLKKNELFAKGLTANNKKHFITLNTISDQYKRNEDRKIKYILNYAVVNASKEVSPYIALNYLSSSHITVLDTINNSMTKEVIAGKYGFELNELVTQLKNTAIGKPFPELTQKDSTNTDIKLENKSGFMLVKLWASYHENSRTSNILAKSLFDQFDSEDFKIISVSLDYDKEKWLEAVKSDNMPWLQVTDLKGRKNLALRKLAIRELPESVLVDNNGIIVGRNLLNKDISKLVEDFKNNKDISQ